MPQLKADLHIHAIDDPSDGFIAYTEKQIIDKAAKLNYKILAITLHGKYTDSKELIKYAENKGIILIPGIEAHIENKHVLLYNYEGETPKTFEELKNMKEKQRNMLIIAPHPFFPNSIFLNTCLAKKYYENKDLFDAVEIQAFYNRFVNFNKKAYIAARTDKKPLVANTDLHFLSVFTGNHYSLIDVKGKPTKNKIIQAIKNGETRIVTKPMTIIGTTRLFLMYLLRKEFLVN